MTYPTQTENTIQTINFSWAPVDGATPPRAVALDAPPSFSVDVPGIINLRINNTVSGSIDGIKAGSCKITASATSGGVPLTEEIDVTVTEDAATTFGFAFSAPSFR
jgi:hypothetical protein